MNALTLFTLFVFFALTTVSLILVFWPDLGMSLFGLRDRYKAGEIRTVGVAMSVIAIYADYALIRAWFVHRGPLN
jgi:hypothetical protein